MVEQTIPQADLNPVRAAVLHRIAQSLARTADTNLFLREALGELSELLQLTFAIVTQRERNEIVRVDSHPEVLLDSSLVSEADFEVPGNLIHEGSYR